MIEVHASPEAMVRCLVSYIPCDKRVQQAVRGEFGTSPCLHSIQNIRRLKDQGDIWCRRGRRGGDTMSMGWDWNGERHQQKMVIASQAFVKAIERERMA